MSIAYIINVYTAESVRELTGEPLFKFWGGGHVHCALAVTVEQGGVRPVAQQQGTDLHSVLGRCFMEGSELPQVHGVHTGSVLQGEQLRSENIHVATVVSRLKSLLLQGFFY